MFETDKQQLDVINRRTTNQRQSVFSVLNPSRQNPSTNPRNRYHPPVIAVI